MMNKIVVILLLSLLLSAALVGFLTGVSITESGFFSLDKIIKFLVLTLAFLTLLFQRSKFNIPEDIWRYILLGLFILLTLLVHHLFSESTDDFFIFRAQKEIVRLSVMLIIFLLCSTASLKSSDYRILVYSFAAAGLLLGILAVYHSVSGVVDQPWRSVGAYLRAGVGITDGNTVAAILNITSMAALAGYLIEKKLLTKLLFLSFLVIAQAGRFATFSNGALLSIVITIVAASLLLKVYHRKVLKPFLRIFLFIAFLFFVFILGTGIFRTVFYRAMLSDEHVKGASIYSRLDQYEGYVNLIKKEPANLIFGVGTASLPAKLGRGLDLHNSYIRPLAVGGTGAFLSFLFLWWLCLRNFIFSIKAKQVNEIHRTISILFFAGFIGWSFQAATLPSDTSVVQWFFFMFAYVFRRTACQRSGSVVSSVQSNRTIVGSYPGL